MKRGLVVLAILAGLVAVPVAYALLTETPVLTSRKNERNPAADLDGSSNEVLAFTRSRSGYPNRYDAYVRVEGNAAVKLNTAGQGWTGGIDYPVVAYQQVSGGRSDIYLYDISGPSRMAAETNTSRWEWHPSIDGNMTDYWILFGRDNNSSPTQRVMLLHHTPTIHDERELAIVTKARHYLQADQVNGNWATYTRCRPVCNVVRYDITAQTRMTLGKPVRTRPRHQYAGAVTSTGAVYLVRSGPNCGEKVKIVRYDAAHGDPALGTVVAALPSGFDIVFAFARENALDGSVDVFYDRVKCTTGRFDIYKVTDPPLGP